MRPTPTAPPGAFNTATFSGMSSSRHRNNAGSPTGRHRHGRHRDFGAGNNNVAAALSSTA